MQRLNPVLIVAVLVVAVIAVGFAIVKNMTPEPETPVTATPGAGPVEQQMGKVTPVVGAVSQPAAQSLLKGSRAMDDANRRTDQMADELFGPAGDAKDDGGE